MNVVKGSVAKHPHQELFNVCQILTLFALVDMYIDRVQRGLSLFGHFADALIHHVRLWY